ncbi:MAG: NADH-quinone oxidoreductase subunit C, partial [Pseudomonadota bacterium]
MTAKLELLSQNLQQHLGTRIKSLKIALDEVSIDLDAADYLTSMQTLLAQPELHFEQLIDLCGVDYSAYGGEAAWRGRRFAAVTHLLSLTHNWRLRVRCFADDDSFPVVPSLTDLWASVNWFEREAFDLYGIIFSGHKDLRRLLTDYGFIGHPFRKDFPLSGYVEMRY